MVLQHAAVRTPIEAPLPLHFEHRGNPIGSVLSLVYATGGVLYCHAEIEDPDPSLREIKGLSIAGRALRSDPQGLVYAFAPTELSLTRAPVNPDCMVLERTDVDPLRQLAKAVDREHVLLQQAFGVMRQRLLLLASRA